MGRKRRFLQAYGFISIGTPQLEKPALTKSRGTDMHPDDMYWSRSGHFSVWAERGLLREAGFLVPDEATPTKPLRVEIWLVYWRRRLKRTLRALLGRRVK
jgi:hypothetical protein